MTGPAAGRGTNVFGQKWEGKKKSVSTPFSEVIVCIFLECPHFAEMIVLTSLRFPPTESDSLDPQRVVMNKK